MSKVLTIRNQTRREFADAIDVTLRSGEYGREDFGAALIAAHYYMGLFSDEYPAHAYFGVSEAWIEEWMALEGCEVAYDGPAKAMVFHYLTAIRNLALETAGSPVLSVPQPLDVGLSCAAELLRNDACEEPIKGWVVPAEFDVTRPLYEQQGYKDLPPRAKRIARQFSSPATHITIREPTWQEFVKGARGIGPKSIQQFYLWLCELGWSPRYE